MASTSNRYFVGNGFAHVVNVAAYAGVVCAGWHYGGLGGAFGLLCLWSVMWFIIHMGIEEFSS